MFAKKGLCVNSCGAGSMPDENNTCVECDGECPLNGTTARGCIGGAARGSDAPEILLRGSGAPLNVYRLNIELTLYL